MEDRAAELSSRFGNHLFFKELDIAAGCFQNTIPGRGDARRGLNSACKRTTLP